MEKITKITDEANPCDQTESTRKHSIPAICPVCGRVYTYTEKKSRTCNRGECGYKYKHNINVHQWAHIPASKKRLAERQAHNE